MFKLKFCVACKLKKTIHSKAPLLVTAGIKFDQNCGDGLVKVCSWKPAVAGARSWLLSRFIVAG